MASISSSFTCGVLAAPETCSPCAGCAEYLGRAKSEDEDADHTALTVVSVLPEPELASLRSSSSEQVKGESLNGTSSREALSSRTACLGSRFGGFRRSLAAAASTGLGITAQKSQTPARSTARCVSAIVTTWIASHVLVSDAILVASYYCPILVSSYAHELVLY